MKITEAKIALDTYWGLTSEMFTAISLNRPSYHLYYSLNGHLFRQIHLGTDKDGNVYFMNDGYDKAMFPKEIIS